MDVFEMANFIGTKVEIASVQHRTMKYSASINRCEIANYPGMLWDAVGFGKTRLQAVKDLVEGIKGRCLVKDAYSETRLEYMVPEDLKAGKIPKEMSRA